MGRSAGGQTPFVNVNARALMCRKKRGKMRGLAAGAGALLNAAAERGDATLVNTLLQANVELCYSEPRETVQRVGNKVAVGVAAEHVDDELLHLPASSFPACSAYLCLRGLYATSCIE